MRTRAYQAPENKNSHTAVFSLKKDATPLVTFSDKRPQSVVQGKLQEMAANNPRVKKTMQLQEAAYKHTLQRAAAKTGSKTNLPEHIKTATEQLSGYAMNDVTVHYNSHLPAQLQAHAYAQGADIHLAPGQETQLPHEAWHVVQQKQGRVQPTTSTREGIRLNNDSALEKEADTMGATALQGKPETATTLKTVASPSISIQPKVIQRVIKDVGVTGITHLVSLKDGSLYQKDYLSNEVAEVGEGDVVEIETSGAIRSRRGPNQETFNEVDATGPQWYVWYPVLSLNNGAVTPHTYIREDTFRELMENERVKDRYQYVADFALSRKGKHWWASFNEKNKKREVGENIINAFAARNVKNLKGNEQEELLSHLVKEKDMVSFKETLKKSNKQMPTEFGENGTHPGGLKTKPNLFIKSLLEEDPENNLYKEALDQDEDHENTILNCEEFAMYVLVQSGFMTRLELSALLKKAQENGDLTPVYTAMGLPSAKQIQLNESLPTGIIFEKKSPETNVISHVVFCAGSSVIHLAFGKTLAEWRAKVESTDTYLIDAQESKKTIFYSPLSRRNVETALSQL